jgi:hypothetical protein
MRRYPLSTVSVREHKEYRGPGKNINTRFKADYPSSQSSPQRPDYRRLKIPSTKPVGTYGQNKQNLHISYK